MTPEHVVDDLERVTLSTLVGRYDLRPQPIDEAFRVRSGDWNGRPLDLTTEIYEGRGPLSRLHLARMKAAGGAVTSLTVIALPRGEVRAPLFGADVVAFGESFSTVIVDVVATEGALATASSDAMAQARGELLRESGGGDARRGQTRLPPFSDEATMMTAVPLHAGTARAIDHLYTTYLRSFMATLDGPLPTPRAAVAEAEAEIAREAQRDFLRSLAGVKKQMKALGKLFGTEWVAAYFDSVFLSIEAVC